MKNQHRTTKDYGDLSQEEIDLINEIKAKGEELKALCRKIETVYFEFDDSIDIEWLMKGRESLQIGIMLLARSVVKPDIF